QYVLEVPGSPTASQASCTGMLTLSKATTVLGSQANNHRDEKRHFPVAAGFVQVKLPILDNLNADLVGRYERFFSDLTDKDNSVAVPSVAVKWDVTDWASMRTSYGKTFSQVNPPPAGDPVPANNAIGTSGSYTSFNYANLDVEPEKGDNFSVGFIFRSGDFSATVDYNSIKIKGYTRTLTAANVVAAVLQPGELTSNGNALINCNSPLLSTNVPGFSNRPYVTLNGTCVQGNRATGTQGSQLANVAIPTTGTTGTGGQLLGYTPPGGAFIPGGSVNYFGGQGQVNSGDLTNNALDVAMSYSFETLGGRVTPAINGTYVTKWHLDEFVLAGVKLADSYDGVGYRNSSTGRLGQGVPEYRLGFSLNYRLDRHNVNIIGRYVPSVINEDATDFNANLSRNANVAPELGGCPGIATGTTGLGSYPANAGTGIYGATCAGYNMAILSGTKIASYFNMDFVYRVEVSDHVDLSLNIVNLLDEDPSFARNQLAYDSGYGNPLGRTAELSVSAKF
ncbi:MAG TPA: TonB-dependent receptor, partial [Steroidobacteraceae bacterium]|nr:TonB-dependent receptor [Steroidobacteraceae bacterium]